MVISVCFLPQGISSLTAITGLYLFSRRMVLPRRAKIAISLLTAMAYTQVGCQSDTGIHIKCVGYKANRAEQSLCFTGCPWCQHPVALCPHPPGSNSPVWFCGSSVTGHLGFGRASQNAKVNSVFSWTNQENGLKKKSLDFLYMLKTLS